MALLDPITDFVGVLKELERGPKHKVDCRVLDRLGTLFVLLIGDNWFVDVGVIGTKANLVCLLADDKSASITSRL